MPDLADLFPGFASRTVSTDGGRIFARVGGYETPEIFTEGLVAAVWVGAAVVGVGALIALLVPGKQRADARVRRLEAA